MNDKAPRSFNTFRHSNLQKRKENRRRARMTLLAICLVIIMLMLSATVFVFCSIAELGKKPADTDSSNPPASSEEQVQKISKSNTEISKGDLLLVNGDYYYDPASAPDLVTIDGTQIAPNGTNKIYTVADTSWKLNETALKAFNTMMKRFYEISEGDDSVRITSAYRTAKDQEGKSLPVGHSDHHTGYCLALRPTGTGYLEDSHWIYEQGHKYGFVLRYPAGKESITGVSDYKYCIRYVGVAHATYMTQKNLCLEEYVSLLKSDYSNGTSRLMIAGADGNTYSVYYVPKTSGELTTITVPKGYAYSISGDNVGGFIVTVNLSVPTE